MSGFFLNQPSTDDIEYDGFFDGQNLTIPNDTELTIAVTDGFVGIEEGKSLQCCVINLVVTAPGEFFGQKYKYNAKIYDMDASKRDLASRNLGVLDAQAGFPMTNDQVELTTESIQELWAGTAEARVKFGLFMTDPEGEPDGIGREINFVRGFGYLREKMIKAGGDPVVQNEPVVTQGEAISAEQAQELVKKEEDDIGF
tara:strand:+ start:140 stop:736 length:597 start_codon:yes stop_codon:yes gene_type:complete